MRLWETPRLIIRDFTLEDVYDLHEILGDGETMKYCEPAYNFEKTKSFLESFCVARRGAVAAVEKKSRKMIGYILFSETDPGLYEIGWFFNRTHWGQGYAFEACHAVIGRAFRELHAQKVFAETIDAVRSMGLMKKLGMTPEGIQAAKDPAGNPAELYVFELKREDWEIHDRHS